MIFHFGSFVLAAILRITTLLVGPGTYYMDGDISKDANGYFEITYLSSIFKVSVFSADIVYIEINLIKVQKNLSKKDML